MQFQPHTPSFGDDEFDIGSLGLSMVGAGTMAEQQQHQQHQQQQQQQQQQHQHALMYNNQQTAGAANPASAPPTAAGWIQFNIFNELIK